MNEGDRFLPVKTSDGIAHAMGKLTAPTSTGDRFIVVRSADGTPMAVKCVAVDASGQRGIPVMLADGVPSLVQFDGCPICQLSPWHGGSMLYERDYLSYSYVGRCWSSVGEKSIFTSTTDSTLQLTHPENGGIDAAGLLTSPVHYEEGPTAQICDSESFPVLYPGPPYTGPVDITSYTAENYVDFNVGLAPKRDCNVETWDASTNTPTLEDGAIVSPRIRCVVKGGTQDLGSGDIEFEAGDYVVQLQYPTIFFGLTLPPEHGNWVKVDPGQAIAGPEWTVSDWATVDFVDGYGLLDVISSYIFVGYSQFNSGYPNFQNSLLYAIEETDYARIYTYGRTCYNEDGDEVLCSSPDVYDKEEVRVNEGYQRTKTFNATAGGTIHETQESELKWRHEVYVYAWANGDIIYIIDYYDDSTSSFEENIKRTFTQGT